MLHHLSFRAATSLVLSASLAGLVTAQTVQRAFVVTTSEGTYRINESKPGDGSSGGPRIPPEIRWQYDTGFAIPQTVALSPVADSAWVGEDLNAEALDRFDISGSGTVADTYPIVGAEFTAVAAAKAADRAAILYRLGGVLHLDVYSSDPNGLLWSTTLPAAQTSSDYSGVKVSRDGSTVAAMGVDPSGSGTSVLHVFEGATGQVRNTWTYAGFAGPIDLDDTGALCLVTQGSSGRLIDTATGTEIFSAPGSGGGSRHKISGDGRILVLGGFSLHVFERTSPTTYTRIINFTAPTSWFGWGAAVSRDGSTVGVMSHDYASGYLNTATRIWDVPTRTLLGTFPTTGTGAFQDSISGGVLSDDGTVLAVSSWGAEDNNHPEVMVFNRAVQMIGSVDTRGSVFSLDMSGGGIYVLSGNKGVHANTFGNGGDVTLYQLRCLVGDFDCNCSVSLTDLTTFLAAFGSCPGDANYNATVNLDTGNDCISLSDLTVFLANFGETCGA